MQAVNIIQGGQQKLIVRLIDDATKDPFNLTDIETITTCFENADGTELMLDNGPEAPESDPPTFGGITVVSPTLGKIQIALTAEQTALLKTVNLATLEIALKFTGEDEDVTKVQIPEAYNVIQTVC